MRSLIVLGLAAAVSHALPWPAGFKYPMSYINKYRAMLPVGNGQFTPDMTKLEVIQFDAVNQRKAAFYEVGVGRSTYEETSKGRMVTIDWDVSQCWDSTDYPTKDLKEDIAKLNDPAFNVY